MKKFLLLVVVILLAGCETDANVASQNLSKAADMFEIDRRIIFYNGITDTYLLTIEGRCSIQDRDKQLEVTCKTADNRYMKHFLGLSDNMTYYAEQLVQRDVSVYRYRVIFKPSVIVPDVDLKTK